MDETYWFMTVLYRMFMAPFFDVEHFFAFTDNTLISRIGLLQTILSRM
jgi:hypothetical protein